MSTFGRASTGLEVTKEFSEHVQGKTIVITGTSAGGLGAETAQTLASAGPAQIILLARSAKKVEAVISKIQEIDSGIRATFVPIELDKAASVREAAEAVNSQVTKIDLLINNAGIMAVPTYEENNAGIEMQLATNHIGHFLFTKLVIDKVYAAGAAARIVNVTSDGYMISPFRFDDWNFSNGTAYDPWSGYGQSKTATILFTRHLATQLAPRGILAFAIHPGVITETSLGNHVDPESFKGIGPIAERNTGQSFQVGPFKTLQQGVSTTLVAALDPRIAKDSGSYLADCAVEALRDYASSAENAERLWQLSEKLIGEPFKFK